MQRLAGSPRINCFVFRPHERRRQGRERGRGSLFG